MSMSSQNEDNVDAEGGWSSYLFMFLWQVLQLQHRPANQHAIRREDHEEDKEEGEEEEVLLTISARNE